MNESVEEQEGCAVRDEEFGRGQNTRLGWNDPPFGTRCVAKVTRGVVPAHKEEVRIVFARARMIEHTSCNASRNARCTTSTDKETREIAWHF